MTDYASRAGYRAAEEEAEWLRSTRDVPEARYSDPAPPRKTVTWREYLTLPKLQPVACAVTGCERVGLTYVDPWTYVCTDCHRALVARTCNEMEVGDE